MTNKERRYRIEEEEGDPRGDVYQLEITHRYYVMDNNTGMCLMQFEGLLSYSLGDSGTWENERYSGADRVEISEDEKHVLVYYYRNSEPKIIKLPD